MCSAFVCPQGSCVAIISLQLELEGTAGLEPALSRLEVSRLSDSELSSFRPCPLSEKFSGRNSHPVNEIAAWSARVMKQIGHNIPTRSGITKFQISFGA